MNAKATHVGFRLAQPLAKELARRGGRHAMSPGQYARLLVEEALENGQEELLGQIAELRSELHAVREDLATLAVALLSSAGKVPLEQAREWAAKNLMGR